MSSTRKAIAAFNRTRSSNPMVMAERLEKAIEELSPCTITSMLDAVAVSGLSDSLSQAIAQLPLPEDTKHSLKLFNKIWKQEAGRFYVEEFALHGQQREFALYAASNYQTNDPQLNSRLLTLIDSEYSLFKDGNDLYVTGLFLNEGNDLVAYKVHGLSVSDTPEHIKDELEELHGLFMKEDALPEQPSLSIASRVERTLNVTKNVVGF